MNAVVETNEWSAANQRGLMSELTGLQRLLRSEPNEPEGATPETTSPALDALCLRFRLSGFERRFVLLCAGMELDGDFAARCAASPGSGGNPWPSFGLALAALPEAHWDALASRAALRHWRLIHTIGNGPLVASRLQIDERILFFLTGVAQLDERLVSLVEPVREAAEIPASQETLLAEVTEAWRSASTARRALPALQLCGADLSAKRALAAVLASRLTIALFRLPVSILPTNLAELENLHRLWEREAILQNAALLLECDRAEGGDAARELAIARWIELTGTPLLISTREPRRDLERPLMTIEVPKPTRAEQRLAWEQAMGETARTWNGQLDHLISQFDYSTTAIRTTATGLLGEPSESSLWDACRLQARPRLQDLAPRITSNATWADIVLPTPQMTVLKTIAQHLRQRGRVY
ncbi:MAG: ATP-binding protein, partial [Verrucomicrobiota bacterium]|nr:ATP-binding protein [Verrucomicrobiota bacterium]